MNLLIYNTLCLFNHHHYIIRARWKVRTLCYDFSKPPQRAHGRLIHGIYNHGGRSIAMHDK